MTDFEKTLALTDAIIEQADKISKLAKKVKRREALDATGKELVQLKVRLGETVEFLTSLVSGQARLDFLAGIQDQVKRIEASDEKSPSDIDQARYVRQTAALDLLDLLDPVVVPDV